MFNVNIQLFAHKKGVGSTFLNGTDALFAFGYFYSVSASIRSSFAFASSYPRKQIP